MLVAAGVVAVLVAVLAAGIWWTMPEATAAEPDQLTSDATPHLELEVTWPGTITPTDVDARIGDERIDAARVQVVDGGERIVLRAPRLPDGRHDVKVRISGAGLLRTPVETSWRVTIDTKAPAARIASPVPSGEDASAYVAADVAELTSADVRVVVAGEAGATVTASSSRRSRQQAEATISDAGRAVLPIRMPQGAQQLVTTTTDAAGNTTERRMKVVVDTVGPSIVAPVPRLVKSATLDLPIIARDPHGATIDVQLNGRDVNDQLVEVSATKAPFAPADDEGGGDETAQDPAADGGEEDPAAGDDDAADVDAADAADTEDDADADGSADAEDLAPAPVAARWKLTLDDAAFEGRQVLEIVATDSLGKVSRLSRAFIVDSTEQLGTSAGLRPGARGADVLELHTALTEAGAVTQQALAGDARARTYGPATRSAVQQFQTKRGMEADGIAGSDTIAALTLKIVIDRSTRKLTLYRRGEVVKVYGVAVGAPEYPTPAGEFEIQSMQKDPTWTPPDSDWARGAEPIPPGPDNPLGTRWMAIDGTVGIHGTNNPASIGFSVSHGCIRMKIPDVEELFEMVTIGTPVTVV